MRLAIAKWLLKGTDYHVKYRPGKHPDTRAKLNGAVSNTLEMDYPMMQDNFDHEEYYVRRAKK